MNRRFLLQQLLEEAVESPSGEKSFVYFQPPIDARMPPRCIVYSRASASTDHADDELYRFRQRYTVIVIDPDPDSTLRDKILSLPLCRYSRHYVVNNLNHDVYDLYY